MAWLGLARSGKQWQGVVWFDKRKAAIMEWVYGHSQEKDYYWYIVPDDRPGVCLRWFYGEDREYGFSVIGNETPFGIEDFTGYKIDRP